MPRRRTATVCSLVSSDARATGLFSTRGARCATGRAGGASAEASHCERSVPSRAVAGTTLRYIDPRRPRSVVYRLYAALMGTRPFGWLSRRFVWKLDPVLLSLTRGRLRMGIGLPTALLETRGARS